MPAWTVVSGVVWTAVPALPVYSGFGSGYAIGAYLAAMGAVSLIAGLITKETKTIDLGAI